MLEPESRLLLLDALRPPAGYAFDRAVGTTFTLDLVALLVTPVAFALFDVEATDGRIAANPVAVLESVRRFSDRITVFTQTGQIRVPSSFRAAYAYLERSVIQVKAPRGGLFHPKVWVIRFVAADGDIRLRFLCLSRNLTFDRSWDTVLRLDGRPTAAPNELSRPLAEFVQSLPGLAIERLAPDRLGPISDLASQVSTAEWEGLPDGLQLQRMWPIGHDGAPVWPFPEKSWRRLAMAPFAEKPFLDRFAEPGRNDVLVSRQETLDRLGASALTSIGRTFVLQDDAVGEEVAPDEAPGTGLPRDVERPPAAPETPELRGLHAKLFVVDQPYWSHIFTGSANATDAAFNRNVEFLVELRGRNTIHGAEAIVAAPKGKQVGFGRLLQEYAVAPDPESVPEDEAAAYALETLAMEIGSWEFQADVGSPEGEIYPVRLVAHGDLRVLGRAHEDHLKLSVRPLSRGAGWAVSPDLGSNSFTADWLLSFDAITAFFAISLTSTRGSTSITRDFVVHARLEGAPADRLGRLLAAELRSRSDLVRLLLMLLGSVDPAFGDLVDVLKQERIGEGDANRWAVGSDALLEPLMRTLSRNPSRLDDIGRLVEELARTDEGRRLLPEGWLELWASVEAARPGKAGSREA